MNELLVVILAAMPISELRGAIPYALSLDMSLSTAVTLSIVGNFIPVIPLLLLLDPVSNFLRRYKIWDKFFEWLFARTRKHSDVVEKYEALGLILFVGIPLPFTGAYSGCVAAFIFGIRFWRALPTICIGILLAATIVSLVSVGAVNLGALTGLFTKNISF